MSKNQVEKIRTTGTIVCSFQEMGGVIGFLVDVELGNDIVRAISINYSSKSGDIEEGKRVMVDYWESPNGNRRVDILGEGMIKCEDDLKVEFTILIGFIILAIIVCTICIVTGR